MIKNSLVFLFLLSLVSCTDGFKAKQTNCENEIVRRAAFDVGSGTTRLTVADVDVCTQTIQKVVAQEEVELGHQEDLMANFQATGIKRFSDTMTNTSATELEKLKGLAQSAGATEFAGVATSAFRESDNGQTFVDILNQQLKLNIKIVPQEVEGEIAFYGAMGLSKVPKEKLIVWDIGGGSMQVTAYGRGSAYGKNGFLVHKGDLASVTFKDKVLQDVIVGTKAVANSPNPMTAEESLAALDIARLSAQNNINSVMLARIQSTEGSQIYGIGGVLGKSIKGQLEKLNLMEPDNSFTQEQLLSAYGIQQTKTDAELGGKYSSTDVTNIALVLGYMEIWQIDRINLLEINNTQGVLVNPKFW